MTTHDDTDEEVEVSKFPFKPEWAEAWDSNVPAHPIFNGTYTVENTKTGEHRTFGIRTHPLDHRFAPGKRIVALLTGCDNNTAGNFRGFGFVEASQIHVWGSAGGPIKPGVPFKVLTSFQKYALILWSLATKGEGSEFFKAGLVLHASTRCIRCNRKLTVPQSIKCGIGPYCAGRQST